LEIIGTLLDCGKAAEARACARQAVELGLWRHPLQRPTHYIPTLTARPVHDPRQFWFTGYLEQNFAAIAAEVRAYFGRGGRDFRPYDARLIDMGKWEQLVLYQEGRMVERACELFPITSGIIATISEATNLGMTSISVVHPGTHIIPHCGPTNARLRVHLCIQVADGAHLEVGGEKLYWHEGECIVFDDSFEHQVWHRGESPRVVLILDVWHPELGPEDIRALSRSVSSEVTIRSFMQERGLRRIECDAAKNSVRFYPDDQTSKAILRHIWENEVSEVELRAGKLYFKSANEHR
jgi:aspartyl/asparaginyl beta-hydroxylase (cupin superfamily)